MAATTASSLCLNLSQRAIVAPRGISDVSSRPTRLAMPSASLSANVSISKVPFQGVEAIGFASRSVQRSSMAVRASELEEDVGVESSYEAPVPVAGTKLYVGNLPYNTDSEQLAEIFQDVGVVELVEVIYDRDTGRSRGFAFVTMASVEEAEKAIEALDGAELGNRSIRVNFPNPQGTRDRTAAGPRPTRDGAPPRRGGSRDSENKLYVGNLSWGMDDMGLEDLFSEFGSVQEARVVTDRETGRSRGFGFVTLTTGDEVNAAVSALDGVEVDGRTIRVNLANDRPPTGGRRM
eukprot:jgi/Mesen1/7731/ME000407S06967